MTSAETQALIEEARREIAHCRPLPMSLARGLADALEASIEAESDYSQQVVDCAELIGDAEVALRVLREKVKALADEWQRDARNTEDVASDLSLSDYIVRENLEVEVLTQRQCARRLEALLPNDRQREDEAE